MPLTIGLGEREGFLLRGNRTITLPLTGSGQRNEHSTLELRAELKTHTRIKGFQNRVDLTRKQADRVVLKEEIESFLKKRTV